MIGLNGSKKVTNNEVVEILLFILIFGIVVGAISGLLSEVIDPANNAYIQSLLQYQQQALIAYFVFVVVSSVIIPLPTLPVDLLLFGVFDPVSVVVVRVLGGVAGGTISYYLAYNYGRPLLAKILSKKHYNTVERLSSSFNWKQFFVITMIPIINTELMAYVGGLGRIGYRKTVAALTLGIGYRVVFMAAVIVYFGR